MTHVLQMAAKLVLIILLSLLVVRYSLAEEPNDKLLITRASRELDVTSQIVKQSVSLTVQNEGDSPAKSLLYTVDSSISQRLAYIQAVIPSKVKENSERLSVETTRIDSHSDIAAYAISLATPLGPKETVTIKIDTFFTHIIEPYPKEITQFDKQLVQFTGNVYIFIPYRCKTQSTNVKLPSSNIESYTRVSPVSTDGSKINYGPYNDIVPYHHARMTLHYENNGPFLTVTSLERVIQISHWGVIQVEEHLRVRHSGALLKGSFSRFDYQRNPNSGQSAVKSYTTFLPAAAQDVYYRDEIGNISTSHLRSDEDYTELILRPRFPLFGGWQTYYYIGYNVPTYEYLYHRGSDYVLSMRFVDHVFDDQVIDEATVKIILPEGCSGIELKSPYKVYDESRSVYHTYLDTVGRPVITARGYNLVEQHILDFELHYHFETYLLLQEPFLLVGALFLFFLLIIGLVRVDFSITKDPQLLARQQASVLKENIISLYDSRTTLIDRFLSAVDDFKKSKNAGDFKSSSTDLLDRYTSLGKSIENHQEQLRTIDNEAAVKVVSVQKKMSEIYDTLSRLRTLADQVVAGRTSQQNYAKEEENSKKKLQQLRADVEATIQTL